MVHGQQPVRVLELLGGARDAHPDQRLAWALRVPAIAAQHHPRVARLGSLMLGNAPTHRQPPKRIAPATAARRCDGISIDL